MVYCITYDCSNKDADKKGLSFFRLPKDHKLRLTWFKKLRLVDPPIRHKRSLTKYAAPTLFSFTKLAVPRVLSERRAKVLEKNSLVASHTDSLLIINI